MIFYKTRVIIGAELLEKSSGAIAQLVEQMTFNHWVQGSSPCGPTTKIKPPFWWFYFYLVTRDENPRVRHDKPVLQTKCSITTIFKPRQPLENTCFFRIYIITLNPLNNPELIKPRCVLVPRAIRFLSNVRHNKKPKG